MRTRIIKASSGIQFATVLVAGFAALHAGSADALTYTIQNLNGTIPTASGGYAASSTGIPIERPNIPFTITGSFEYDGNTAFFNPGQSVSFISPANTASPPFWQGYNFTFNSTVNYTPGDTLISFDSGVDRLTFVLGAPLNATPANRIIPISAGAIREVCRRYNGSSINCSLSGEATFNSGFDGSLTSVPSPFSPLSLLAAAPVMALRKRYKQS